MVYLTGNTTHESNESYDVLPYYNIYTPEFYVKKIVLPIILLVGVIADIFIIFMLARYPRLRRNIVKVLMLNWAIADIGLLVSNPVVIRLIVYLAGARYNETLYCVYLETLVMFDTIVLAFVFFATIDWCVADWRPHASEYNRKHYKYIIAGIWVLFLAVGVVYGVSCGKGGNGLRSAILTCLGFIAYLIFIIAVHITRCARKEPDKEPKLMLHLGTCFIACYFLSLLAMICYAAYDSYDGDFNLLMLCPVYLNSVLNLALLINLDKDFNACFRQQTAYVDSPEELNGTSVLTFNYEDN